MNINDKKLSLLRLEINNASTFDEAKDYASLILNNTVLKEVDNNDNKNGIYIVEEGSNHPIRFKDVISTKFTKNCNVMISYNCHNWIVDKKDVSDTPVQLLSDVAYIQDNSKFYKNEIEALNDFNMKSCTEHLRKSGLGFNLNPNAYIPTLGQLAAMFTYYEELNEALKMIGGCPMKKYAYWSSSKSSKICNWFVRFYSGKIDSCIYKSDELYIRPCLEFNP